MNEIMLELKRKNKKTKFETQFVVFEKSVFEHFKQDLIVIWTLQKKKIVFIWLFWKVWSSFKYFCKN